VDLCLAVDVGGTKLAAGIVSRDGEMLLHSKVATPRTDDPEALFGELARLVSGVVGTSGCGRGKIVACGVGCGGPIEMEEGLVSPLNIRAWRKFPLRSRMEVLTGLEVGLDNDAKALTVGEGWVGAARGCTDFLGMVVSTGVGGGIVLDGKLLEGATGNAGHVGHVIVEPEGRTCGCGARGCLEAEASGTAIAAITGGPPRDAPPSVVERTGMLVGRAVATVANLLDLQLAVVAGSVALGFGGAFFEAANAELSTRAKLSFAVDSRVVPAGTRELGPLLGAAAVGWRRSGHDVLASSR
jgi:glucokinase